MDSETTVRVVDRWKKTEKRYASGVLIEVTNGKGMLREEMVYTKDTSHLVLAFGNQPLVQLQGAEYFCPTCEKILKSAYGLEQSEQLRKKIQGLNRTTDFYELVESLRPFWGLLKDGNYILLDTKLYPTDGNGHLFWNVPNSDCELPGTCVYYYGDCEWGNNRPYFTVATQPYGTLDSSRVDYYVKHPWGRALAYYMDGYMTALIDGHHKAMAAAKLHNMVDALVIIPCYAINYRSEDDTWIKYMGHEEFLWNCSEYGLRQESTRSFKEEPLDEEKLSPFFFGDFSEDSVQEICELAAYYPDVHGVASMDLVGEITEQRLDNILSRKEAVAPNRVIHFLRALTALKHSRTMELFDFFLHESTYAQERYSMTKEIVVWNVNGEWTDYLIGVMVEFEEDNPKIRDLILDYI